MGKRRWLMRHFRKAPDLIIDLKFYGAMRFLKKSRKAARAYNRAVRRSGLIEDLGKREKPFMEMSNVIEFVKPYISNIELLEFLMIGEQLATPEDRWRSLQDWLKRNDKWNKKVNAWLELSPDGAYIEIRQEVINQAKSPQIFGALIKQFITGETEARIIASIGNLQTLYKQRRAAEKVIKRARRVRRIEK